jgi:hypothetical protein
VSESDATNLSADDTNGETDIYIHDRTRTGSISMGRRDPHPALSYTSSGTIASAGRAPSADLGNGDGAVANRRPHRPRGHERPTDVYSTSISALVPVTSLVSKAAEFRERLERRPVGEPRRHGRRVRDAGVEPRRQHTKGAGRRDLDSHRDPPT